MASQEVIFGSAPDPQVVGIAFVEQYYNILHQSPEQVYRFYQDSSKLSRPEPDGKMVLVTTMQAIDDKMLSLNFGDLKPEIKTVDAQKSFNGGVIVLVTGCLTGKDNVKRKFTQSFFLAPQDSGYFVLNDVFRYVEETELLETDIVTLNVVTDAAPMAPPSPDSEPDSVQDSHVLDPATTLSEEEYNNGEEVCDPSENGEASVVEEEVVVVKETISSLNEEQPIVEMTPSVQKEAPKKSYAYMVMKESTATRPMYVPKTVREAPASVEQHSNSSVLASPIPVAPGPNDNLQQVESDGCSIYIRGLPLNATIAQLEEQFKKFGPIKHGGIQVRSNKQQGFCFGFVEFESSSSMHRAIEASVVVIGDCEVVIEEKRTSTSRVGSRGRFPVGRGGFRNDGPRGRGNFPARGYGGRGDFGNRGRGYQRVDQNGDGRSGHPME